MPYSGTCPSCNEALSFVDLPLMQSRCARCGAAFLAMVPEGDPRAAAVEVELVKYEESDSSADPSESARTARQLVSIGSASILTLCAGFVALLLLVMLLAATADGRATTAWIAAGFFALLVTAGTAFIARQVRVRSIDTRGFSRFRSVFSVLAGGATLMSVMLLVAAVFGILLGDALQHDMVRPLAVLGLLTPGALAGCVVARIAPSSPIWHATTLALLVGAGGLCLGAAVGSHDLVGYLVSSLAYTPGLLLGAWGWRRWGTTPPLRRA